LKNGVGPVEYFRMAISILVPVNQHYYCKIKRIQVYNSINEKSKIPRVLICLLAATVCTLCHLGLNNRLNNIDYLKILQSRSAGSQPVTLSVALDNK